MTIVTVTPAMQQKAEKLAEMLPLFPRGRAKANGTGFYLIPGSKPTTAWYSNHAGCNCPGFQKRGTCTHQLACLLVVQRAEAPRIEAAQANYQQFGQCVTAGCIAAATGKSKRCDPCFARVVSKLGI